MDSKNTLINVSDIDWSEGGDGARFAYRRKQLSGPTCGVKLGASLYELDPGHAMFPFHAHMANEEAIFVLRGGGTLRLAPDRRLPLRQGDFVALPAGMEHGHQVLNEGEEILQLLCFSTMIQPDVVRYLDSNKLGVFAGSPPGGDKQARTISTFLPLDSAVGYYHGEDEG